MSDADEYEYDESKEEIARLEKELDSWKAKYKSVELKKRESDLALNKLKTEINSLRSMDKLWKDACRTITLSMRDMKQSFDVQIDQILDAIAEIHSVEERIAGRMLLLKKIQGVLATLQRKISKQDDTIMTLNGKLRVMSVELAEKTAKVERLSQGIEEEVERLVKPIRDKLSDAMTLVMKEKMARAQERRELADLWPPDHLLPTVLMRYRALTAEERERRTQMAKQQDASLALSIEIRANVAESRMWEVKYDDYGRQYFEHMKTGETRDEMPEIMQYRPPPGRDEMGNLITSEENDLANWTLLTDNRGQVYYRHKLTQEVTYIPPSAYQRVPPGKTRERKVAESAAMVLSFIKEKIEKHIAIKTKRKQELENPLSFEEQKKKDKADRNRTPEEIASAGPELTEEDEPVELTLFQYDIETVEMLAGQLTDEGKKSADADPEQFRKSKRSFLDQHNVRRFDEEIFAGKLLKQWDPSELTVPRLRGMVEELAMTEEKLEKQLSRTRTNLKEYSFLLQEKIVSEDEAKFAQYKQERMEQDKQARYERKLLKMDRIKRAREAKAAREAARAKEIEAEQKLDRAQSNVSALEMADNNTEKNGEQEEGEEESADTGSVAASKDEHSSESEENNTSNDSRPAETTTTSVAAQDALLPIDEEERHIERKERHSMAFTVLTENEEIEEPEDLDQAEPELSDDQLRAELEGDVVAKLFGELDLDNLQNDFSEALKRLARKLSNFAMFCGFTNLNASKAVPDDNHHFSLSVSATEDNEKDIYPSSHHTVSETVTSGYHTRSRKNTLHSAATPVVAAEEEVDDDDEWLTTHFFLGCDHHQLDTHNQLVQRKYEGKVGNLPIGPLNAELVVFETMMPYTVSRPLNHAYTKMTRIPEENNLYQQYLQWKNHQLLGDVVRSQLQQLAVHHVIERRLQAFSPSEPQISVYEGDTVPMAQLRLSEMRFRWQESLPGIVDELFFAEVSLGRWLEQTPRMHASQYGLEWPATELKSTVTINDAQLLDLFVRVYRMHPESVENTLIAGGHTSIQRVVGTNFGKTFSFDVSLFESSTRKKSMVGTFHLEIVAEICQREMKHVGDPLEKSRLELLESTGILQSIPINTKGEEERERERKSDAFVTHDNFSDALDEQRFRHLVSDLRGDLSCAEGKAISIAQYLTGDFPLDTLTSKLGNERDGVLRAVKPLPNIRQMEIFLEKKYTIFLAQLSALQKSIKERTPVLLDLLKSKGDATGRRLNDAKSKYNKLFEQSEELKREVLRCAKTVADLRVPLPAPKEPEFEDFPPLPRVPEVQSAAGLDSRGKKKKALSSNDLKVLIDAIEAGEYDGKEALEYPENLFPSQAQALKINKAAQARNALQDAQHAQEVLVREQAMQFYESEKQRWETAEKKRSQDLEKAKKESRKQNLKYDCLMERLQRFERESAGLQTDAQAMRDLRALHDKCSDQFKLLRVRAELEKDRQQKYIASLRVRMLRAINARRFALDFPRTATNEVQWEEQRTQAEEALQYLKTEIFECRTRLEQEGMRLRHSWEEEESAFTNELARINVSIEVLQQRDCIDQLLARYKVEIVQMLVELEKHKLAEANLDDVGLQTVNDEGERFISEKTWSSPNVVKCTRALELLQAKVDVTEGLGRSASESQRRLVDVLHKQASENSSFFVRDSWLVASDYERAQQLSRDTLSYLQASRTLLKRLADEQHRQPLLQCQLAARLREEQMLTHHALHEQETKNIRESSERVLDGARKNLASYREESEAKLQSLERAIVDLSRECQKVREELLLLQMAGDDKRKVLWALIHTLQSALKKISAKMEIANEERERVVIESRLMADNTRHQLRVERQHCANLSFIIHSQRGTIRYLKDLVKKVHREGQQVAQQQKAEKFQLKKDLWETVFVFTRLCTDVDLLFEFFATRVANLSGSRATYNDQLARNNAALVLAALCKNPQPVIRRAAARALGNMGWNGFTEMRILQWDCVMYWKMMKSRVIGADTQRFEKTLAGFCETGRYESAIDATQEMEEFSPSGKMSLRSLVKQRRQWALRAARRVEGPNVANQKLLNVRDGVLEALLRLCVDSQNSGSDGSDSKTHAKSLSLSGDWEISRNAALAISIASYEPVNHAEMVQSPLVRALLVHMCALPDAEIQTHAAVTIANLCHRDEEAQRVFGEESLDDLVSGNSDKSNNENKERDMEKKYGAPRNGVIPLLLRMLDTPIADVLEAATAALANLTCYCDANCETVFRCDGLSRVMKVITQAYSENLLDLDQNDEVHANAAEVLANISRYSSQSAMRFFTPEVIDALVLMCASSNTQLRRHVSLVLGNISQSERCREEVGFRGGVEALFLCAEDADRTVQANALWALSNLMWHPPNQERAGRFMAEIVSLLLSPYEPVMVNANILLGNVLYYNTTNRVRFLDIDNAFETLIAFVRSHYPAADNASLSVSVGDAQCPVPVLEASLRSLLSLSYLDAISMWLGEEGQCIPVFLHYLCAPHISRDVLRNSLEIVCNLCLHHANRRILFEQRGVEAIVPLHADADAYVRDLSVQIIEHLEDITPAEVLVRARGMVGLERMVVLASNEDPLVRAVASEAIGEEVWRDPAKQAKAHEIGAIDTLLGIAKNAEEPLQSLLPALWSLRNLLDHHSAAQAQFGFRDGVKIIAGVIRRGLTGEFREQTDKLFEAAVFVLIAASTKDPRNSRRIAMVALDALIEISEESSLLKKESTPLFSHAPVAASRPAHLQFVVDAIKNEGVQALVNSLLLSLAPFNYVVCKNCGRKQDLHGTSCFFCGHRLLIEGDTETGGNTIKNSNNSPSKTRASQPVNNGQAPPWRHAGKAMTSDARVIKEKSSSPGRAADNERNGVAVETNNHGITGDLFKSASKDDKRSYFSRTLPIKTSSSAPQLPAIQSRPLSGISSRNPHA